VLVRDATRPRPDELPDGVLTTDLESFLAAEADVVVEAIGGQDPALRIARAALAGGKRLVTANKALLALHGPELAELARCRRTRLDFEAAVGGGIPVLRSLRDQLAGAEVQRVRGILNGTTNYILSRLSDGVAYADALREAQRLGYAEADPSRDVGGLDAADKLRILAWLGFGVDPARLPVRVRGIGQRADRIAADAAALGGVARLVGEATRGERGVSAAVEPVIVRPGGELAQVRGPDNLITVETRWNGVVRLGGPGAGGSPTASALLGDLVRGASPLRTPHVTVNGVAESAAHDWVVSAAPGGGAERLLLRTLERAGVEAKRVVWAPDAVRAVVRGARWRQLELGLRALEVTGLDPLATRMDAPAADVPVSGDPIPALA
jgi:homoserine dehydrogenase